MFIVYTGNGEILVTTKRKEEQFLFEYMGGKDLLDYERIEINDNYVLIGVEVT